MNKINIWEIWSAFVRENTHTHTHTILFINDSLWGSGLVNLLASQAHQHMVI